MLGQGKLYCEGIEGKDVPTEILDALKSPKCHSIGFTGWPTSTNEGGVEMDIIGEGEFLSEDFLCRLNLSDRDLRATVEADWLDNDGSDAGLTELERKREAMWFAMGNMLPIPDKCKEAYDRIQKIF